MDDYATLTSEWELVALDGIQPGERTCRTSDCMWENTIHSGECY